ncbi:sigmaY antisigma factor component [Alicyclobacillus fastidiosus]|uniref:SigmaY antisigma factor component n=1 Tax=Alicyclobacillus fastidiosus TaxID=392011 RepID=A0ABV5AKM0_9BACL|nr:sigmaY antisigma factor component [Alicyclobacillus fastidiosus]WEH08331.1 sigmaY antisigma factor component [Alicyclobacillus fastidiosus]
MKSHGHLTWELVVLIVVILLVQGIWLFIDARHRSRWPWLWGGWGLLQFPGPTIFYLLFVRKVWKVWRRS